MQNKNKLGIGTLLMLNLFIFSAAALAQDAGNYVDLNGKLEVLHADDFEHPENSRFIFYLNVDGKRYVLESREPLPVVMSGTAANVKGNMVGNQIYVQSFAIIQPAPALSQLEESVLSGNQNEDSEILQESIFGFKLNWHYGIIPLAMILGFLAYIETRRKIDHARLLVNHRNNKVETLTRYIQTYLKKGYSKEQIRNALVKYNYKNQEIDEAFKGIR